MRRFLLASLATIAFTFPAFAQAKHPFTFEDMMKLKRVGEPEVSPDGKWVIFSVVDVNLEANTKTPHIWIVPTAGGQEREIIANQDADRPRWAPDGKRFAFISTKDGGSQVWIAEFGDGAGTVTGVHQLTAIATEASGELWSPDGKNILFTSDVYPECDGERDELKCNAGRLGDREKSKVRALVFDHLLYRHWNAYKEGKRTHIFMVGLVGFDKNPKPPLHQFYTDLTPGDYDAPVFSLGGQDNYAFSPDGQEICYTSNHDKNPAASTNNDLWIVPVAWSTGLTGGLGGGDRTRTVPPGLAKNITADNPASDSTPLYAPDGRYIAYRAQQRPGYESDRFRLMLYDRKTGEKKNLTENFDVWVGTFAWVPDSTGIYFAAQEGRGSDIRQVSLNGEEPKDVVGGAYVDDPAVSRDGSTMFFTRMSVQWPTQIYKVEQPSKILKGEIGHLLVDLNRGVLSQVSLSPLEYFLFPGAHGDKVEGFLVKPPNFDASKKYPVKFLIHGGPQGAWGDDWSYRWNPQLFAANGYVVIMINFHGSTGYGQKFIDAINGDWGGAPFEDLMKGLDYAEKTYPFIDKDRECALGASYGGYMANWVLGHTDRFKCIVSHDGMFNTVSAWGTTEELWFNNWEFKGTPYDNREAYRKWSPHEYAKNFKTPTLVIHGQRDYRLDVSQGFDLFTTLQMEGVPSKMLYFPDEGHWVLKPQNSQLWYKTVNDWVD
ncbi:MAG: S9 family peptidase, partial [Candidatus Sulfotelmatobacter sp.]